MSNSGNDKLEQIANFDPNSMGISGNLFGLPFSAFTADIVILPVPWEVTVSYTGGTAKGPAAVLNASSQVDLYVRGLKDAWKMGIAMLPISDQLEIENEKYRNLAITYLNELGKNSFDGTEESKIIPRAVNEISKKVNMFIRSEAEDYLHDGKIVGLLGGDHSTPLGLITALAGKYPGFGVLQIDAHADLRKAYENFVYSHASIMYNVLKIKQVEKLVQVGVRDICDEEILYIDNHPNRITTFFQEDVNSQIFNGTTWDHITDAIISELPDLIYISFDIDGLDPKLCPNTGTPVPSGLSYAQVTYLIQKIVKSGKKIIGFDLSEVSPGNDEWDANVGARILYMLSCWTGASNGFAESTL